MRTAVIAVAILLAGALLSSPVRAGPTLLFEPASGQILYAEDVDGQWHPASLTKIMTAYVTFEALKAGKIKLDTKIGCSQAASAQPPSKLGLPQGAEITVDTALQALIVKSANDVAVMLAEAVGGSEAAFVEQMNATAKRLGMDRTSYVNPNGLPAPGQITTARDLAKLARAVIRDFPEYNHYWSQREVRVGKRVLGTHNSVLTSFEGADGFKTGFICDAGYNIVASATRGGHRLMAIVLGAPSALERKVRAESLLEHGFANYGWKQLFNPANIDTLPQAPDAKGITTMRTEFAAWNCGLPARGRAAIARTRQLRAKAAARVAAQNNAKNSTKKTQADKHPPKKNAKAAAAAQHKGGRAAKPKTASASATAKTP